MLTCGTKMPCKDMNTIGMCMQCKATRELVIRAYIHRISIPWNKVLAFTPRQQEN
uniref:Uncharacterized protein n=1 Tax=Arundo donax TaxID=35708 RepID=A0A0A9DEK3_ARUDO